MIKINDAAESLHKYLLGIFGANNLISVGKGHDTLFIYLANKTKVELPTEWEGHKVVTRIIGKLQIKC